MSNVQFVDFLTTLIGQACFIYSPVQNEFSGSCFMKQKCQIQMGTEQYKHAATPLRTRGINTTHQHSQMKYITLILWLK